MKIPTFNREKKARDARERGTNGSGFNSPRKNNYLQPTRGTFQVLDKKTGRVFHALEQKERADMAQIPSQHVKT
jgi:hypothetical protein